MKSAEELCMEYLATKPSYYNSEAENAFLAGHKSRDPEVSELNLEIRLNKIEILRLRMELLEALEIKPGKEI